EPIALLVIRLHAANTSAESHRDHGCISRIAHCGHSQLPLRSGRTSDGAHFSVRPWLRTHPGNFVIAIGSRRSKNVVISLGKEMAALVHLHKRVSPLHRLQWSGHVGRNPVLYIPKVEVVRCADKDRWILLACVFWTIYVSRHALSVAHRHHQFAFDNGNGLELSFCSLSLLH